MSSEPHDRTVRITFKDDIGVDQISIRVSDPSDARDSSLEFPDGGWQAWSVVFGSWCALLPSFGIMNVAGTLEGWLADHQLQGYSQASISWIFRPIFDSHGVKYTLIPGCLGFTTSKMKLSVSQGGLSASAILPPSLGTINHWFYKRRGLTTGWVVRSATNTSGGIEGIIFTNLFGTLRDKIGFVSLGCFSISMLFTRTRLAPNKLRNGLIDLRSLREPTFTMTSVAVTAAEIGLMVVLTYLPSYAPSPGYSRILADRWGRFSIMILARAVCTTLILALWLTAGESEAAIISFATLFGFWAGPAISLTPVCVAQILRTEDYGKRYKTTTTTMLSFCLLVAIPVAGEVLKAQNPSSHNEIVYSGLIVFCGLSYACSTLSLVLTKGITVGWGVTRIS
ncbi:major facilitator superfamily domain-containing protein [Aspergillus alliaceus]|uniref:Major facilitator superfamily domain-containing protein n=1 Tax=Petromyces alliaceus TaxID=209559 RepID=A0A5N7BZX5_PETAA|nr:major facilitator superfamily domain-containing protein [Aspergillus alliaceus]